MSALSTAGLSLLFTQPLAFAEPIVVNNTISWPDDGWYQVQTTEDRQSVCQGGRECVVDPGLYIVINHSSGQRWEDVTVVAGSGPTVPVVPSDSITEPSVYGNELRWPNDGWYQVQDATNFQNVCEGGLSCELPAGSYNVINHSTGARWNDIAVPSSVSPPDLGPGPGPGPVSNPLRGSDPIVNVDTILWASDGWYQVQETEGYTTVCEGGNSCVVSPGEYVVINHDNGTRWTLNVQSGYSPTPGPTPEPDIGSPVVDGNTISWAEDGWYQVQTSGNNQTICNGGRSCIVEMGSYVVINHSTGQRWNDVMVEGGPVVEPEPEPEPVSSNPNQLVIYDGDDQSSQSIPLPLSPSSVSVSPDGLSAAVGHDSWISHVD